MRESTQSNSPAVTFTRQYSQVPAMPMRKPAPQFGQFMSPRDWPRRAVPRIHVQYSE
jgi:hypothetical protein